MGHMMWTVLAYLATICATMTSSLRLKLRKRVFAIVFGRLHSSFACVGYIAVIADTGSTLRPL